MPTPNYPNGESGMKPRRLLRLPEVLHRIGISRSGLYQRMADGEFPPPVKLGRTSVWIEDEIDAWMNALIAQR